MSLKLKTPDASINHKSLWLIPFDVVFTIQNEENDSFSNYADVDDALLSGIEGTSASLAMDEEDTDQEMVKSDRKKSLLNQILLERIAILFTGGI